jgi:hypothetical protein
MDHAEFRIGARFWTDAAEWLCTDVGTRVIVAIQVGSQELRAGPPYADALELVFNEYDFEGCYRSVAERTPEPLNERTTVTDTQADPEAALPQLECVDDPDR